MSSWRRLPAPATSQARFSRSWEVTPWAESARRNPPHGHQNRPTEHPAPNPTQAHAGVDMSEGWFRRLKSGGVAVAFAIGLLTAGLLRLPYSFATLEMRCVT